MRTTVLLSALAVVAIAAPRAARAQGSWPPPAAGPAMRSVVSYEISAALVSRRLPGDWANAIPDPLLARMEGDEHFAAVDIGSQLGNGILIRFDFDDMASYREWSDSPDVKQMLAQIEQAIGYGYSRSSLSMRRVALYTRDRPASPRRAPAAPPAAVPAPPAKPQVAAARAAVQKS